MEPFIRRKVKTIIDYEAETGGNSVFDVTSIKEGDTSITYNTDEVSRETIYGLSEKDKQALMRFRRLRDERTAKTLERPNGYIQLG